MIQIAIWDSMGEQTSIGSPPRRLREAAKQLDIARDQLNALGSEYSDELAEMAQEIRDISDNLSEE